MRRLAGGMGIGFLVVSLWACSSNETDVPTWLANATMAASVTNTLTTAGANAARHCFQIVKHSNGVIKARLIALDSPGSCPSSLAPDTQVRESLPIDVLPEASYAGTREIKKNGKNIGEYYSARSGTGGALEYEIKVICASGGFADYSGACHVEAAGGAVSQIAVH